MLRRGRHQLTPGADRNPIPTAILERMCPPLSILINTYEVMNNEDEYLSRWPTSWWILRVLLIMAGLMPRRVRKQLGPWLNPREGSCILLLQIVSWKAIYSVLQTDTSGLIQIASMAVRLVKVLVLNVGVLIQKLVMCKRKRSTEVDINSLRNNWVFIPRHRQMNRECWNIGFTLNPSFKVITWQVRTIADVIIQNIHIATFCTGLDCLFLLNPHKILEKD